MSVNPRAGTPAQPGDLIDVPRVVLNYYTGHPDPEVVGWIATRPGPAERARCQLRYLSTRGNG